MSSRQHHSWPTDHPEIIAIALNLALDPTRRRFYSPLVLSLVDAATEELKLKLTKTGPPQPPGEPDKSD